MSLLLREPLWIVVIVITLALHVAAVIGVRKLLGPKPAEPPADPPDAPHQ